MTTIAAEQQALAEAVHVLVTQLGLSQRDASRILGIPQEHVSQIVSGQL
ncbi:helix-turn-helix domain-containing protein [Streptomyces sirii]